MVLKKWHCSDTNNDQEVALNTHLISQAWIKGVFT